MKRTIFFMICWILPSLVVSQRIGVMAQITTGIHTTPSQKVVVDYKNVDAKYLAGAVKKLGNRVVFQDSIPLRLQAQADVFAKLKEWEKSFFGWDAKMTAIYENADKNEIAFLFEDKLKFNSSVAYASESDVSFNVMLKVYPNYCDFAVRNIKYKYQEGRKDINEGAEKMITDDVALDKNGKLVRYFDKFRYHTLDAVWGIQASLQKSIGVKRIEDITTFSKMEKLLPNFDDLFSSGLALFTYSDGASSKDERIKGEGVITASADRRKVVLKNNKELKTGDVFTISFYTETYRNRLDEMKLSQVETSSGGLGYSEAWMLVECRVLESSEKEWIEGEVLSIWSK